MKKLKRALSMVLMVAVLLTTVLSNVLVAQATMLPLREVRAYLVLNGYSEEQLKSMPLSYILDNLQDSDGNSIAIDQSATIVWTRFKPDVGKTIYDEYQQLDRNETVDVSDFEFSTGFTMDLIVGSGHQLDPNNVRYIVKTYISNNVHENLTYELYTQDEDGTRHKIEPSKQDETVANMAGLYNTLNVFTVPDHVDGTEYYLGINSIADEHPDVRVDIYTLTEFEKGLSYGSSGWSFDGSNSTPITNQILNQNMTRVNAGYKCILDTPTDPNDTEKNVFGYVLSDRKTGYVYDFRCQQLQVVDDVMTISAEAYAYENGSMVDVVMLSARLAELGDLGINVGNSGQTNFVEQLCLVLKEGYTHGTDYHVVLNIDSEAFGAETKEHVAKVVLGTYTSAEDAAGQPDIKDQLFPSDTSTAPYGYTMSYESGSYGAFAYFTIIFDDGLCSPIEVVILPYDKKLDAMKMTDFFADPVVGAKDPWLRVTGAKDSSGATYDTYAIENGKNINMDTYYGYGYETLFINDANADLSTLEPTFWYANTERVYAVSENTGDRVEEGHRRDFTNENQQYTGIILDTDGTPNERNYWVTFKKLNSSGPELFVYGPREREVILNEYFEFKHDILIANIGNVPLEELNVELLDAENVKLDPYWTVGNAGNDTLAPFTTTEKTTKYGELANMAKIRLLPDGDGEVKGTLKITAKDQEPVLIVLNGTAQNPEIITGSVSSAVKYVPYQQIIATNNMHDWIETRFSVTEGAAALEEIGLSLNSATGEIYGMPTAPDGDTEATYQFTVEAKYFVDGQEGYFDPSYKEYTLVVKPNTDENVYLASDESADPTDPDSGYGIKQPIGTKTGDYSFELDKIEDTVFISYGQYDEFVALWLNGEKLVEGVDYTKEPGSTKVTVKSQTFENKANKEGSNTIAQEFRDSSNELNRTSQNFKFKDTKPSPTPTPTPTPTPSKPSRPSNPSKPSTPSNPPAAPTVYGISVNSPENGKVTISHTEAEAKTTVKITATPNDGYEIDTVVASDANGNSVALMKTSATEYSLTMPGSAVNVKCTFVKKYDPTVDTGLPFSDVYPDMWFTDGIDFAYKNGLMIGANSTEFLPDVPTTRAMFVTVLYRLAGEPETSSKCQFGDVLSGSYYEKAVTWAAASGIVNGCGAAQFKPDDIVTREQLITILYNYAKFKGIDVAPRGNLSKYTDRDKVSEYATEAMSWANAAGVVVGTSPITLSPQGDATRAQVAVIMKRFCEHVETTEQ